MITAELLARKISQLGIRFVTGIPDSSLSSFCEYLDADPHGLFEHVVPHNEGAAAALAMGHFMGTGHPAAVYMQNSGLGNIVNPLTSLLHQKVYAVPALYIIGWRGEPGRPDEPQHRFMGAITPDLCRLLDLTVGILRREAAAEDLDDLFATIAKTLAERKSYALIVQPGALAKSASSYRPVVAQAAAELSREAAIGIVRAQLEPTDAVIATTGKTGRELYEIYKGEGGNHAQAFLTVGGMGHAAMIAAGFAMTQPEKRVCCLDGDGAALMHMGSLPCLARWNGRLNKYVHIILNNGIHDSVGGMPIGAPELDWREQARAAGYRLTLRAAAAVELKEALSAARAADGPILIEVIVRPGARADLGRPKENALTNINEFMNYHGVRLEAHPEEEYLVLSKDEKTDLTVLPGRDVPEVFTCFTTDVIHEGHINLLRRAKEYGRVTVGVLADEAAVQFSRFPTISYEERFAMVAALPEVDRVMVQHDLMYDDVFERFQPDIVIHGDNWRSGFLKAIRDHVERRIGEWGGRIIDVPYTHDPKVKQIERRYYDRLAMPELRRGRLRKLLKLRPLVKVLEAHNGLTGLIVEKTVVAADGRLDQFDAIWVSSLCDSTARGKPDIELVDLSARLRTIDEILEVTTKPIILDGDTGGQLEHFVYNVRTLERMGVSAVIVEDKTGLKKNSLFGTEIAQTQDTIENFCAKIRAGKEALLTDDFMIIARIESLILEKGMEDALARAIAYTEAGVDGIMIHSRRPEPDEIFAFCREYRAYNQELPIVVVPTTYNQTTEEELAANGINVAIYANQLTRSAFPAMERTAQEILQNHRAYETDKRLMSIKEIISLIDLLI